LKRLRRLCARPELRRPVQSAEAGRRLPVHSGGAGRAGDGLRPHAGGAHVQVLLVRQEDRPAGAGRGGGGGRRRRGLQARG